MEVWYEQFVLKTLINYIGRIVVAFDIYHEIGLLIDNSLHLQNF